MLPNCSYVPGTWGMSGLMSDILLMTAVPKACGALYPGLIHPVTLTKVTARDHVAAASSSSGTFGISLFLASFLRKSATAVFFAVQCTAKDICMPTRC